MYDSSLTSDSSDIPQYLESILQDLKFALNSHLGRKLPVILYTSCSHVKESKAVLYIIVLLTDIKLNFDGPSMLFLLLAEPAEFCKARWT